MKLKEYLQTQRIDIVVFSISAGLSISTIYRCCREGIPHPRNAIKIEKATKGLVTAEELLNPRGT